MAPGAASEAAAARLPPALARPGRLLATLLLLACAAGPPGGAAQQLTDGQLAVVEQQCPVSVRYAITLGEPEGNGTSAQVPIFVATMTLENNANVSGSGNSGCCCGGASGSGAAAVVRRVPRRLAFSRARTASSPLYGLRMRLQQLLARH